MSLEAVETPWKGWVYNDQDQEDLRWARASQHLSRRLHDVWVCWKRAAGRGSRQPGHSNTAGRGGLCPGVCIEAAWNRLGGGTGKNGESRIP